MTPHPTARPTTWFISDLHLGHQFVAELRGFHDISVVTAGDPQPKLLESGRDTHDSVLAHNWDRRVRPADIVWILGDITLGPVTYAFDWLNVRPGTKHLILGNHDSIHPAHRDAQRRFGQYSDRWTETFASIQTFARRRIAGREYLLSHFPYPGTSEGTDPDGRDYDDRYLQYRLLDLGVPLLHGHTHRNETSTISANGTKQFHVGVDAHGLAPVHISTIEEWLTA